MNISVRRKGVDIDEDEEGGFFIKQGGDFVISGAGGSQ